MVEFDDLLCSIINKEFELFFLRSNGSIDLKNISFSNKMLFLKH